MALRFRFIVFWCLRISALASSPAALSGSILAREVKITLSIVLFLPRLVVDIYLLWCLGSTGGGGGCSENEDAWYRLLNSGLPGLSKL